MAGIYDVGDQTSGLPTYLSAPAAPTNPYNDPAFAQASYQRMMQGANPQPGIIGGALSSAYHETLGQLGGFAQAAGQAEGFDSVAKWGSQVAADQAAKARAGGRTDLEGDWSSPSGIAYNAIKSLPMLAGTVLASRFGGGRLASALNVSREAGEMGAAGLAMFPTSVGGNVEAAKAANNGQLSTGDAWKALALGAPEAAVQAYMPGSLSKVLRDGATGDLPRRLLMGGGVNALVGGGQGAVTTALTGLMDPNKSIIDRAQDVVQGAIGGAVGGGVIGAATHGLSPKTEVPKTDPNAKTEDLDAVTAAVDPVAAKAQVEAAAPPAPEPPKTLTPANDQPGVQLFTPEETAARVPQVVEMRKALQETFKIKGKAGDAFLDSLQATNQPELIAQVRDQADFYLENAKKNPMPTWFENLAKSVGVLDKDGAVVQDINQSVADRRALGDKTLQDAEAAFQAAKSDTSKQGQLKLRAAERARSTALDEASDHHAEADRLEALAPDHAAADQLPSTFAQREAPAQLKDKPEAALWQSMMSISERGPSGDLRNDAFKAAMALRRGDKNAVELAKKVQDDYAKSQQERMSVKTDATAPAAENDLEAVPTRLPLDINTPPKTDFPVTADMRPSNDMGISEGREPTALPSDVNSFKPGGEIKDAVNSNDPEAQARFTAREGLTNDNPMFGTENVNNGARVAKPGEMSVRTDEPPTKEAANNDRAATGERPEVTALKTDETAPRGAANENQPFGTERTGEYKTDAEIENERLERAQAKEDAPRKARLLNDNVGDYDNLRPSPEALAFARDHASYTGEQPPVAMHVIGPANKNQTPKQQAAIEKAKATREANAAARAANIDKLVNTTKGAQKRAADAAAAKETARQAKLQKLVDTTNEAKQRLGPSDPNILAKLADPVTKRPGDDDIAFLVGNKEKPIGDSATVLDHLAQNGDSDFVKLLASRLKKLGVNPTVSFGTKEDIEASHPGFDTKGLSAAYDEKTNHVWLVDRTNLQSNFLHEMIHAALHDQIEKGGPLVDRLADLRTRAMKHIADNGLDFPYGMTDLHEFVSEAMSDPAFRKLLADIPSERKTWTLLDKFKDAITKLLGLPNRARSLLDDVIGTADHMMDNYAGHPARPGSIADSTAKASIFAKRVDDVQKAGQDAIKTDGVNGKFLPGWLRRNSLGWNTFTFMADHYGKYLPSLNQIKNTWEGRDVLESRLHQLHKVPRDMYEALPQPAQDAVCTLMGWTRHGIDPRKTWEEHTQFHQLKDADKYRALVTQARNDWNHARNVGGDAAHATYNMLDFSNKADHYMKNALLVNEYGKSAYRDLNRAEYTNNLGTLFANDATGMHTDPKKAMEFWKAQLASEIKTVETIRDTVVSPKLKVGTKEEQKAAKKEFDAVSQLTKDIGNRLKSLEQAPYFHEGRQGDFFVSAKLNLGDDKQLIPAQVTALQEHLRKEGFGEYGISQVGDNPSIFMRVDTQERMGGLLRAMQKAQEKGWLDKDGEINHGMPEHPKLWNSVAPQYLQRMVDLAKKNPNFSKEAEAELRSRWLDVLSDNSLAKLYQHRQEAQGWNKDMMHNFTVRSQAAAKSLSGAAMHGDISDAMTQMDNEVQAAKAGTDPDKTIAMQDVANEVIRREMERGWKVDTTFADRIRGINHVFHLGMSLPYMMEQLSQIPMLLLPELGKTHGFVKSGIAIGKVTGMAFKIMKAIASGGHGLDAVVTPEALIKGGIDPATAKFMMDIVNRSGLDLSSFTREFGIAAKGGGEGKFSRVMHLGNVTAIYAETFGRVVSALAARELHGAKEGSVDYAKQVLDQAMMSWQPWNTSRQTSKTGIAGQMSPLMLSFTGYQTRMIEKLYREVHDAFAGDTPAERAASRKFLAMHLGAATTIAGTLGMPFMTAFAGAASKLANLLTGDDRYDVENSYREFLTHTFGHGIGQAIAKGPLSSLGLDLSELGDQNLLPFTNFLADRRKMEDRIEGWAKDAMGSPVGTVTNVILGLRDIGNGLPLQGVAKMLPTALKGPLDAYRVAMHGYEDKNGTHKPVDADVRDVLARVAGFHTTSEAEYNDKSRIKAGLDETRLEREQAIKQRLLLASAHNDPEGYQSAVQAAQAFGRDHPLFQPMATFGAARSKQLAEQARARALGMPLSKSAKDDIEQRDRLNW